MRTFQLFGYEILLELWCPFAAFSEWQLGYETNLTSPFKERLLWLGSLHIAFNKIN